MEKVIKEKFIIEEIEFVQNEVARLAKVEVDWNRICGFMEEEKNVFFFLDNNLKRVTEDEASYVWIDSGYSTEKNESIFISLLKQDDFYHGYFVGTAIYLTNGICNRNPRNSMCIRGNIQKFNNKYPDLVSERKVKNLMSDEVNHECRSKVTTEQTKIISGNGKTDCNYVDALAEEIYNNIKYPNWKSLDGLKRYLKIIGHRIETLVEQGKTEYYMHNKIGAVVNTGLIDKFGEDYLLYYKIHRTTEGKQTYKVEDIVTSKQFYELNGFTSICKIKPICFRDEGNKVFKPNLEDFDITSRNLKHIINERNERFPSDWQNLSELRKAEAIRCSLINGIKMQERDEAFAKPIYSTECKGVSWVLPLYLNRDYPMEPELVLVIRKQRTYYEVKTVLPYDDELKDRITSLSLYQRIW